MSKKDEVKSTSDGVGKKKTGRPSSYVKEVADDICMLLAQGESLRKICERPISSQNFLHKVGIYFA